MITTQPPLHVRHATHPAQILGFDTAALREHYLVEDLFTPDTVTAVLTHHDRIVLAGARPASGPLALGTWPELRSEYFLERREAGIVNVGAPGRITVDGAEFELTTGACLYAGRGAREVVFEGADAAFYLFSAPAHTDYPTTLVEPGQGNRLELGDQQTANRRIIDQYIHADGVQSCQIVLGVTTLHSGSTWNTMPAHTHDRRTECYLYFGLPESERVVHLLGEPEQTRHLLVADRQAVISPSWSIHSGAGTSAYSFVWAMAGENQAFSDMDGVDVQDLR
ncbi:4-deoxy-L-threo-5-hexosulose-uronateketol-isomerase [Kribbella flavida DSM 17836]|uniref:4-deoxy-L-threo-5-hexosulose-uronate ketol-isomerase n=1 Tax=Kribbella flavida (strain DSM 17836 / JCM 10339 / NBRC 14399) TaxID=479435 RepID=D2PV02_KRIFD|nr:5-dehydro-4-deoxy-D-glucuronate isomerase [Kribbella flavida]ADB31468.1 4-deoxy-L-threo-5-hexosulose-uronateketol-isomerase [Kribbella flavida DSM 17836]